VSHPRVHIDRIDHVVLTVTDLEATATFYEKLGFHREVFGDGRTALHAGTNKINLHEAGREFEPKAAWPTPGSGDLCFVLGVPLDEAIATLDAAPIVIDEGPVDRTGALGPMRSVYVRDPDRNLIELSQYL
jgi:catechol 2,3-dioxygenase-like lactoylglutathione lyase family enzyme